MVLSVFQKAIDALNNGEKLVEELEVDLKKFNDWVNSNPDLPLASNLRFAINSAASAIEVVDSDSEPAPDPAPVEGATDEATN